MRKELKYDRTTESAAGFPKLYESGYQQGRIDAFDAWRKQGYVGLKELRARRLEIDVELEKYEAVSGGLKSLQDAWEHFGAFLGEGHGGDLALELERIEYSRIPKLLAALKAGSVGYMPDRDLLTDQRAAAATEKLAHECEKFIVNNSYKTMIKNKEELTDAEWHCPYNLSCFEFHMKANDKFLYFIVFMLDVDGEREFNIAVNVRQNGEDFWFLSGQSPDANVLPLAPTLIEEIRAICILLDADVVVKQQHRVAARINDQRGEIKDLPEYEFHTLQLRKSVRYEGTEIIGDEKRRSPRLHLRRGHWRRVGSYKTWVRWSVVGDATLGIVDKQYKA